MTEEKTYDIVHPETGARYTIKNPHILLHPLRDGERPTKCVEFTIIGQRGEWENWAVYAPFMKINPFVEVAEAA